MINQHNNKFISTNDDHVSKKRRITLPSSAVEKLKDWMNQHWSAPYPSKEDLIYLSQICNISTAQVNNW